MSNILNNTYHELLKLPEGNLGKVGKSIKPEMVTYAINLEAGKSREEQLFHTIYSDGDYRVDMAKPGKEVFLDTLKHKEGRLTNNANDMRPNIFIKGVKYEDVGTFTAIFEEFQLLGKEDEKALDLMACLLFRNAFVLDHVKIGAQWVYSPPSVIVDEITRRIGKVYNVPVIVFLQFLEGLAYNEDVKYHTLGHDITTGIGRRNNLLTCVNIIGVFMNKISFIKLAGAFSRPPTGIAAISQKLAREVFPLLDPESSY